MMLPMVLATNFDQSGNFTWNQFTSNMDTTQVKLDTIWIGGSTHTAATWSSDTLYLRAIAACIAGNWIQGNVRFQIYVDDSLEHDSGTLRLLPEGYFTLKSAYSSKYPIYYGSNIKIVVTYYYIQYFFWTPIDVISGAHTLNVN